MNLVKSSCITLSVRVAGIVSGLASSVILARTLGPSLKGVYTLTLLIPALLMRIGNLGIGPANVFFAGRRKHDLPEIVANSLLSALALGVLLILLFWAVSASSPYRGFAESKGINASYVWALVAMIPIGLSGGYLNHVLLGREKIVHYNGVHFLYTFLRFLCLLVLLVVLKKGLLGAILTQVLVLLSLMVLPLSFVSGLSNLRLSPNFALLGKSVQYGSKAYLGNLAQFLNYRLDMFMVAYFLNVEAVGYYAIAVGIAEVLWLLPDSVGTVLFPRIASVNRKAADELTPRICRNTLVLSVIAGLVLLASNRPLIRLLFGSAFLPSAGPLVILIPGVVALSISKVLTSDLAGRGRPEFGALSSASSLALNVPLNLILIPRLGIQGAAFASTVAYAVATGVVLRAFLGVSKESLVRTLIPAAGDLRAYSQMLPRARSSR